MGSRRRGGAGPFRGPDLHQELRLPLYFGLGDAARVDRAEVDWPSGRKQLLKKGLRADDTLRVTEPR